MTPMHFEAEYGPLWNDFAEQLAQANQGKNVDGALLAARYRRVCENLALAQSRAYPIHLVARLEALAQNAHQLIYRRQDYGLRALARLLRADLPSAVRAQGRYVLLALGLFALPLVLAYALALASPDFALHLLDAGQLRNYEAMYADGKQSLGRLREAAGDWQMFGFYVMHNIGIGFQCFAGGLFAGIGSVFFLVFNGVQIGGVAGYLTARGHGENFYSFVVTHGAFELTAIVLSGAAGLRLGYALLAPGRRTRLEALKHAAGDAITVVYGVIGMLVAAAAVEAFWSSARWLEPAVKYGVGALCWALVLAYLGWQGRPAKGSGAPDAG
jgi:uncharacterized membrane protein SpoIIM required for sporulation